MLLPLALAFVTAVVLIVVIAPLWRGGRAAPERLDFDRAVYRDQLKELERDLARGVIGASEAAAARLEIERRMLVADRADVGPLRQTRPAPLFAAVLAFVIAVGAGGVYLTLGAPGLPDLPFAARTTSDPSAALAKSVGDLEQRVAAKPDDSDAWLALGRAAAELRDWERSADAYRHAVSLVPARTDIAGAYGEVLVMGADGIVTPAARDVFAKLLAREPKSGIARYYLALGDAQAGKTAAAIAAWQALAAEAPANAPIRAELERRIKAAADAAGIAPPPLAPAATASAAPAPAPGPDARQVDEAAKLPPDQQQAMVRAMVERLATRLQTAPDDVDGWVRLARSYGVLGERDKAADAYEHAAKLDPKNVEIPLGEIDALLANETLEQPLPDRVIALLHRVETLSPDEPEALWYLGLAAAQRHEADAAAGYWRRLLAKLPADAPERKTVTAAIDSLKAK